VLEIGAGTGLNFSHYPSTVSEVVAVEPEPYLRERAEDAARSAPVPVRVISGTAERLPAADGDFDAGVACLMLCSVRDQDRALSELYRAIRPGGQLRFLEHVRARTPGLARAQRLADATFWPLVAGGCHSARDTGAGIERAGFRVERCRRFPFRPAVVEVLVSPHIVGTARRP
jgi:ubiquinone/menaquinone biosynthesis C-methylase UbiE